jgi:Flp pilus assembly protein TadD
LDALLLKKAIMARFLSILALFATTLGAIGLERTAVATAGVVARDPVCDVAADDALGRENYAEAIKLHQRILAVHANDALAHYHLGFAYGMVGRPNDELAEYRKAAGLGLRQWDLYVNLGRRYLESGDYPAATGALLSAVATGPHHPEAHFNLGLAYERRAMLPQAEQEMRATLRLDPNQAEASNMLAIICVEAGNRAEARRIWSNLADSQPTFAEARTNLAILNHAENLAAPAPSLPTAVAYAQSAR